MTYKPQPGTFPARALAHLRTLVAGTKISTRVLADALDVESIGHVATCMKPAVAAGLVRQEFEVGGRNMLWSLGDGQPSPLYESEADEPLVRKVSSKAVKSPKPAQPLKPGGIFHSPAPAESSTEAVDLAVAVEASTPAPPSVADVAPQASLAPPEPRRTLADVTPLSELPAYPSTISREFRFGIYSDGQVVIEQGGGRVRLTGNQADMLVRALVTKIGEAA